MTKQKFKKIKVGLLKFDWNVFPRHTIQSFVYSNVNKLEKALKSGVELPPIIINENDNRIVDGFHRAKAIINLYGIDHIIKIEVRNYKNDKEMFLEAAELNNNHGLVLTSRDRAYVIMRARELNCSYVAIAKALGMKVETMREFYQGRIAKTKEGKPIVLSNGSKNLSLYKLKRPLTKLEEKHARSANGCKTSVNIALLLNALKVDDVVLTEKTIENLKELKSEIERILQKV